MKGMKVDNNIILPAFTFARKVCLQTLISSLISLQAAPMSAAFEIPLETANAMI